MVQHSETATGGTTFSVDWVTRWDNYIQHFISAAVRHDGVVLGYLRVYRAARDRPYQVGDDDLIQVLADRIGYVIAESRVRQQLEQQRTEHQAVADRLQELTTEQRELLEQLADVEERERTLLAEAIHDGPMQLVVAVMMCLENSSISHGEHRRRRDGTPDRHPGDVDPTAADADRRADPTRSEQGPGDGAAQTGRGDLPRNPDRRSPCSVRRMSISPR